VDVLFLAAGVWARAWVCQEVVRACARVFLVVRLGVGGVWGLGPAWQTGEGCVELPVELGGGVIRLLYHRKKNALECCKRNPACLARKRSQFLHSLAPIRLRYMLRPIKRRAAPPAHVAMCRHVK
jgi:hypothetical protein